MRASLRSTRELLDSGLAELGLDLPDPAREALVGLAELLAAWAQRMNLTAHRTPESIVARLILDAAALEQVLPPADRIIDLGSGAGFPGLPLAVLRPDAELVLIEAREKRHHFQRAAVRQLGLSNVRPLRGRAEQLESTPAPLVIAQALAAPDAAIALALSWVEPGGWIGIPGSEGSEGPQVLPPIHELRVREYSVPGGGPNRKLWLGQIEVA